MKPKSNKLINVDTNITVAEFKKMRAAQYDEPRWKRLKDHNDDHNDDYGQEWCISEHEIY